MSEMDVNYERSLAEAKTSNWENEPLPGIIWYHASDFRKMLARWLKDFNGVPYARDAMDLAHGDWTPK